MEFEENEEEVVNMTLHKIRCVHCHKEFEYMKSDVYEHKDSQCGRIYMTHCKKCHLPNVLKNSV